MLFDWRCEIGQPMLYPAAGLPTVKRIVVEKQARFLSSANAALLREAIDIRPTPAREVRLAKARDWFVVDMFERSGLRAGEASACQTGHVVIEPVPAALRSDFHDAPPVI
ncbi:hypothetical protein [Paraburkholderia tropica]|uniref:hypothetical protein n=1 Tax=Paraburkholderia tropica TaxID=92647 RepID=UPI002AB2F217|nr:hypothetical protein [Paraburkholderia tropica]